VIGGLGSLLSEFISKNNYHNTLLRLGIPDRFIQPGKPSELYKECGFDADGIYSSVKNIARKL
jgi:1-deoxy-D-xylulose-5-phosphate synthase